MSWDGVDVEISVLPDSLEIHADRQLLDQVLVNLVKNAVDALQVSASPELSLRGKLDMGRTQIRIQGQWSGHNGRRYRSGIHPVFHH